jgi:hypothetical protein
MKPSDPPIYPEAGLEAWVIRTRLTQGLPARVEDPTALARIADLMGIQQAADCQHTAATEN